MTCIIRMVCCKCQKYLGTAEYDWSPDGDWDYYCPNCQEEIEK